MRFDEFPLCLFLFVLFKSYVLGDRQEIFFKISYRFLNYARAYLRKGCYAHVNAMTKLTMNVK